MLALHGLGLESSSFTGLAQGVNDLGLSMLAADLPGFRLHPGAGSSLDDAHANRSVLGLSRPASMRSRW